MKQKDLSHLDRNIESLIQELATRCSRIFTHAAGATARSAVVTERVSFGDKDSLRPIQSIGPLLIREHRISEEGEVRKVV